MVGTKFVINLLIGVSMVMIVLGVMMLGVHVTRTGPARGIVNGISHSGTQTEGVAQPPITIPHSESRVVAFNNEARPFPRYGVYRQRSVDVAPKVYNRRSRFVIDTPNLQRLMRNVNINLPEHPQHTLRRKRRTISGINKDVL